MAISVNQINDLIRLADQALKPDENLELKLDAIELYCAKFQELEKLLVAQADNDLISELSVKHSQVLMLTESILGGTVNDIKRFKQKAKGIMAYVDVLPSKISVTGVKKG